MRVLFFGTYDVRTHPRVRVLQEGFAAAGDTVLECNAPLGLTTAWRVRLLQQPWMAPVLFARLLRAWVRLAISAARTGPVDAVVVGYLGQFDVHLARILRPRVPVALDQMVSLADTAADRGGKAGPVLSALRAVDRAALRAADAPFVDTVEHLYLVDDDLRPRTLVVPVGAPREWFRPVSEPPQRGRGAALQVIFYGLYTPLQGAPVIGDAIRLVTAAGAGVQFTMVGSGQELAATRECAGPTDQVDWVDWVDAERLPALVAAHHVCLGIFGTGAKAWRVVPNKVFQGAAAGCAIVTSDTPPQRAALGGAALYVPPGEPAALATALTRLALHPTELAGARRRAASHAREAFRPDLAVDALRRRLLELAEETRCPTRH